MNGLRHDFDEGSGRILRRELERLEVEVGTRTPLALAGELSGFWGK
jgi:hypothetical protein